MDNEAISESGSVSVTLKPKHEWDKMMSAVKATGVRLAMQLRKQGHHFIVEPLAPKQMQGGDTVPLSGVVMQLDWRIAKKLEMVESARDMISNAYIIGSLDPGFPTVLSSIINGEGLYEHSVGEFFQLYGQFEGKHQTMGTATKKLMEDLVNGDTRYLKPYQDHGQSSLHPLPYAVRNILAHAGHNPNTLDPAGRELRTSIELLRTWLAPKK